MTIPAQENNTKALPEINLFFTGGYDSSFRLAWLVLVERRTVQPIYCLKIDSRENQAQEIAAQNEVIKAIVEISGRTDLILPTRLVGDIPRDRKIELAARTSVGRFRAASQYGHLARYTLLNDLVVECGLNRISPSFKWPYGPRAGFRNMIWGVLTGEGGDLRVDHAGVEYLEIFANIRFPIVRMTKEMMWELALTHGFSSVLKKTFSCWHPREGKSCGKCFNCQERFLQDDLFS